MGKPRTSRKGIEMEDKKELEIIESKLDVELQEEDELQIVIKMLMESYVHMDFKENVQNLHNDLIKVFDKFQDGKYQFFGVSSNLGVWEDIRLSYDLREKV